MSKPYYLILIALVEMASLEMNIQEIGGFQDRGFQDRGFQNIKCLRIQKALSSDSRIHMLICNKCDLHHVVLEAGSNKTWAVNWNMTKKIVSFLRYCADPYYITDAEFLPSSDRGLSFKVIYAMDVPTKIFKREYTIDPENGTFHFEPKTELSNRGLGVCNGIHFFSTDQFKLILIADSFPQRHVQGSGSSIKELDIEWNTTTKLDVDLSGCYPHDFTVDPHDRKTIFIVTNVDLRKMRWSGNQFGQPETVDVGGGKDTSGKKVLAVTSEELVVIDYNHGLKLINLKHRTVTASLPAYQLTGIDIHTKTDTLLLASKKTLYYISNIDKITKQLSQPATTKLLTTTTQRPTTQMSTTQLTTSQQSPAVSKQREKAEMTASSITSQLEPSPSVSSSSNKQLIIMNVALLAALFIVVVVLILVCGKRARCRQQCIHHTYDEAGRLARPEHPLGLGDMENGSIQQLSEGSTHHYSMPGDSSAHGSLSNFRNSAQPSISERTEYVGPDQSLSDTTPNTNANPASQSASSSGSSRLRTNTSRTDTRVRNGPSTNSVSISERTEYEGPDQSLSDTTPNTNANPASQFASSSGSSRFGTSTIRTDTEVRNGSRTNPDQQVINEWSSLIPQLLDGYDTNS